MRWLACVASLYASGAVALSCGPLPTAKEALAAALEGSHEVSVVVGELIYDGSAPPIGISSGSATAQARLVGSRLTAQGEVPFDHMVQVSVSCIEIWCGHWFPPEQRSIFFMPEQSYAVGSGPCGESRFHYDPETQEALLKCLADGGC